MARIPLHLDGENDGVALGQDLALEDLARIEIGYEAHVQHGGPRHECA